MTLQEFLKTASSDNLLALQEARQYTVGSNALIPATTINQLAASYNMTGVFQDVANNPEHPARHKIASVLLSIQGNHDFNFIEGTTAGNGNLQMFDWLIAEAMPEYAAQLTALKLTVQTLANRQTNPFANITLQDVLITRNQCPVKPVEMIGRFAVIETTSDVELHNPRLLAFNPRLHSWQSVNVFRGVSVAGKYECEVPMQWVNTTLVVDDAYGVISDLGG